MLKYKDHGVTSPSYHVQWKGRISKLLESQNNSLLPGVSDTFETNDMYGAPPLFHNVPKSKPSTTVRPSVHMKDRKANMEAMLVSLLAEKCLPVTVTGGSIFDTCFILVSFKHNFGW